MPILFPVAYSGKYGYDEFLNVDGDFSISKLNMNYDSINENNLDIHTEHISSTPLQAIGVAYDMNLEYSNLFESLLNELDENKYTATSGLYPEYDETNSGSSLNYIFTAENNFDESGIFEDDTVIDDPQTMEFEENTVYESELETYFRRFDHSVQDQKALEVRFPGFALLDKRKPWDDRNWEGSESMNIYNNLFDTSNYTSITKIPAANKIDTYSNWFSNKNKMKQQKPEATAHDRTIAYYGFKNSHIKKLILAKLREKLIISKEAARLARSSTKLYGNFFITFRNKVINLFRDYMKREQYLNDFRDIVRKDKPRILGFLQKQAIGGNENPLFTKTSDLFYYVESKRLVPNLTSGISIGGLKLFLKKNSEELLKKNINYTEKNTFNSYKKYLIATKQNNLILKPHNTNTVGLNSKNHMGFVNLVKIGENFNKKINMRKVFNLKVKLSKCLLLFLLQNTLKKREIWNSGKIGLLRIQENNKQFRNKRIGSRVNASQSLQIKQYLYVLKITKAVQVVGKLPNLLNMQTYSMRKLLGLGRLEKHICVRLVQNQISINMLTYLYIRVMGLNFKRIGYNLSGWFRFGNFFITSVNFKNIAVTALLVEIYRNLFKTLEISRLYLETIKIFLFLIWLEFAIVGVGLGYVIKKAIILSYNKHRVYKPTTSKLFYFRRKQEVLDLFLYEKYIKTQIKVKQKNYQINQNLLKKYKQTILSAIIKKEYIRRQLVYAVTNQNNWIKIPKYASIGKVLAFGIIKPRIHDLTVNRLLQTRYFRNLYENKRINPRVAVMWLKQNNTTEVKPRIAKELVFNSLAEKGTLLVALDLILQITTSLYYKMIKKKCTTQQGI